MKIALVTSSGGHLFKTFHLKAWWHQYDRYWVTKKDTFALSLLKQEKVYAGHFPEIRHPLNVIRNFVLAWKLFHYHRPDLVFSTGAGIAPAFFLAAKLLGIKTIFMETFIFIPRPTLSGKIIYHFRLADVFLVQHPHLLSYYSRARHWGQVL